MKSRIALALLTLIITGTLTGCQQSASQPDNQPAIESTQTEKTPPKTKTAKPPAPKNTAELSWQQDCSVEQAFNAARIVLEDLGLAHDLSNMRTIRTRDPRTGRMLSKQVPANREARSDGLSAVLKGKSTADIDFDLNILFVSPETSQVTIQSTSYRQSKETLKDHAKFLKQQIIETIEQMPPDSQDNADSAPYPKTIIFDRTVNQVSKAIYEWVKRENFDNDSDGADRFYKHLACRSGSGIGLTFTIRLIDTNKAKLEIEASNYEDKDEFKTILQGLQGVLEELKTGQTLQQATYTETIKLNKPVSLVHDTIISWAMEKGFSTSNKRSGGDQFYKYCSFYTVSKIDFDFKMFLTDSNQTTLEINIRNHEDKQDFPMILQSLKDLLAELSNDKSDIQETGVNQPPLPKGHKLVEPLKK